MPFAIKVEVRDPRAQTLAFKAQKTMYGGKHIAKGDTVFIFASENEGGKGLIARAVVTAAEAEIIDIDFAHGVGLPCRAPLERGGPSRPR